MAFQRSLLCVWPTGKKSCEANVPSLRSPRLASRAAHGDWKSLWPTRLAGPDQRAGIRPVVPSLRQVARRREHARQLDSTPSRFEYSQDLYTAEQGGTVTPGDGRTATPMTFKLSGEGGTGKTSAMKKMQEWMGEEGIGTAVYAAYTGAAVAQLPGFQSPKSPESQRL